MMLVVLTRAPVALYCREREGVEGKQLRELVRMPAAGGGC